jgi:hypothetical protein
MKSRRHVLHLVWLVIPLLTGCWESSRQFISRIAQYREPLNSARIAKGIPPVPNDWVPRGDRSAAAWDNPDFARNRKAPGHQYKFLTFSDPIYFKGTLISETDHYESGKVWQDPAEGTQVEFARITYSYEDEKAGKNPWRADVCRQEAGVISQRMSLEDATAVLRSWGISRINEDGSQPNQQGGANGRQPFGSDTNRTSTAAVSRRSPWKGPKKLVHGEGARQKGDSVYDAPFFLSVQRPRFPGVLRRSDRPNKPET